MAGLLALSALACGGSGTGAVDAGSLSQCIVGWWQDPTGGGCICPISPECQFADCQGYHATGFLADKRYFSGYLSLSVTAKTMTTQGMTPGVYATVDGGVHVDRSPNPAINESAVCSSNQLLLNFGQVRLVRAWPGLAAALDQATADGGIAWTSYPFSPP